MVNEKPSYPNIPQLLKHLPPIGQPQPEFVVFTEDSISYDDGYGSHGVPSVSTRQFLQPTMFYSKSELEEWLRNTAMRRFDTKQFRVFALKPVEIGLTINVDVK